ncbi:MAG TPA: hypothetical protein PLW66_13365, partial [Saprospiraceae bacterium]|nr:hypothetical protein [Saprospiraceae bacterium]
MNYSMVSTGKDSCAGGGFYMEMKVWQSARFFARLPAPAAGPKSAGFGKQKKTGLDELPYFCRVHLASMPSQSVAALFLFMMFSL